jgi:hypothetical protein
MHYIPEVKGVEEAPPDEGQQEGIKVSEGPARSWGPWGSQAGAQAGRRAPGIPGWGSGRRHGRAGALCSASWRVSLRHGRAVPGVKLTHSLADSLLIHGAGF